MCKDVYRGADTMKTDDGAGARKPEADILKIINDRHPEVILEALAIERAERGEVGSVGQGERYKVEKREGYTYVGLDEKAQPEAGAVTLDYEQEAERALMAATYGYDHSRQASMSTWLRNFAARVIKSQSVAPSVEELEEAAQTLQHEIYVVWLNSKKAFGTAGMQAIVKGYILAALERKQSQ